jgi:TolA-binding protein
MTPSSSTLRQAADLQERIEQLQQELDALFQQTGEAADNVTRRPEGQKQPVTPRAERRGKAAAAAPAASGRGRQRGSPSGPLAPAVVQVLKAKGTPLRVAEILEGLRANGYRYPAADPKKNLSARIYRLKGVKQVAPGQFAAE